MLCFDKLRHKLNLHIALKANVLFVRLVKFTQIKEKLRVTVSKMMSY